MVTKQLRRIAEQISQSILPLDDRPDHAGGVGECAEHQHEHERRQVGPLAESADAGAERIAPKRFAGHDGEDADVVVRAGVDAVEAERAIQVALLARLEEMQLAAGDGVAAANALFGRARCADGRLADLDFQRRDQRLHEVELADRADVFAERRAAEEAVDDERRDEIADRDPGRQPGAVPERERFVAPQEDRQQADGEPFAAEPSAARVGPIGSQRRASVRGSVNGHAMQKTLPATSSPRISRPRQ